MKRLAWLPILALTFACSDAGIVQPDSAAPLTVVAAAVAPVTPANGGVVLEIVATYSGPVDPGQVRITPGGVMHWTGILNEFVLSGDVEGLEYVGATVHMKLDQARGPVTEYRGWLELTSILGQPVSGGFECRANGFIENNDDPALFMLTGKTFACKGWGDLQGKHMKTSYAIRIGTFVYDMTAVIW